MKKFKRVLAIMMAAVISLSVAGCGANKVGEKDITLTWFIPSSAQADQALVMEKVSEITKEKIGVSLDVKFIDVSAYNERMTMNMASGNDFDLCFTGYVNKYEAGVFNGGFMQLDDLLKEHAPKLMDSMPEYAWEVAKVNGGIYAVPNLQGFVPPTCEIVFKDLADKYNFDTDNVKKPEDLEPLLKSIKENEPTIYPMRTNYGVSPWVENVYEEITCGLGVRIDGSSSDVVILSETDEYKQAIATLHDWYKKGYIRQDVLSCGDDIQDLNAGRYGVYQGGWLPGAEASLKQSMGREAEFVKVTPIYMRKSKSVAAMTAIGKNCKHPEKAIQLIELVNTDAELINLLTLGIKDKHYKLDEDGKYELIEGSGYKLSGAWLFGNQFLQILAKGQDDDVWEQTEKMNLEAVKSPILGFSLDTSKIKTLISQVTAATSNYPTVQAIVDNNAGAAKNLEERKVAGLEELRTEIQKQIDTYWATKN